MGRGLTRLRRLLWEGTFVLSPDGRKKSHIKSRGKSEVQNLDSGKVTKEMSPERPLGWGEGQSAIFPQARPHRALQQTLTWLRSGHFV